MSELDKKRWKVRITYIPENIQDESHFIDELEELQDIVEFGYNFHLIKQIIIEYNYNPKRIPEFDGVRFCG